MLSSMYALGCSHYLQILVFSSTIIILTADLICVCNNYNLLTCYGKSVIKLTSCEVGHFFSSLREKSEWGEMAEGFIIYIRHFA